MKYSREEIQKTIAGMIEELFEIPQEDIQLESRLNEDLDLDSIDAVDLIVRLQEFVGKRIQPEDFKEIRTFKDVVDVAETIANEQ